MKPKLIILNGPLGIGKSTLAKKYADEHPLTLLMDIDELRKSISHWREHRQESARIAQHMANEMVRMHLKGSHDVVVPQIYRTADRIETLEKIASGTGADFFEILLYVSKEESIKRFISRGQAEGNLDGFHVGGLIDKGGREKKLEEMYDEMMDAVDKRPNTVQIEPKLGDIEDTYQQILEAISQ